MDHYVHLFGKVVIYAVTSDMNHYTHLYGSTVIYVNRIRSMVILALEACVRYLLYIFNASSLVWGLLRLSPIT